MVGLPPSTLSGLLQDTLLHKGPPHIDIVGVQLSLASYKFGKVEHLPGSESLDHGDGPDMRPRPLLY